MGKIELNEGAYNVDFLSEEKSTNSNCFSKTPYKILIADDEEQVHVSTKMILKEFNFEGKKLEFISTYTREETIKALNENPDIAIVLLDVVMDEFDTGLKLIEYIRNTQKNMFIRIILRTGQPGEAPEEKVIVHYDINDYLLKTEITVRRLFASFYQALRAYRDIIYIDNNRKGLEKIIKSSSQMFNQVSIRDFFNCILNEVMSFRNDNSSVCFRGKELNSGLVYLNSGVYGEIIAATGDYEKYMGKEIKDVDEFFNIFDYVEHLKDSRSNDVIEIGDGFLIWIKSQNNNINFIFIQSDINDYDIELIKVFLINYSLSLDNFITNQRIQKTQFEIIHTLGDAIEKRSHETANHVRRVSEITYLIAEKAGLPKDYCETLKIASTLHDVGKVGIPDSCLMKPGKLTDEEFEIIKTHTLIGHKILQKSELEILKEASDICLYHHEKYNGRGYPTGLMGEDIPLHIRIVALVDVFDALTHPRCYKEAWSIEKAVEHIKNESGLHFDPKVVDLFLECLDEVIDIKNRFAD